MADGITGFGAAVAVWSAGHVRDPKYSGPVFDPDPSLSTRDKYTEVDIEDGRVLGYDMHFNAVPISQARALAAEELPSDAAEVAFVTKDTCAFELFRSAKLGRALGARSIGDPTGAVLAEFGSGPNDNGYEPSSVNDALFSLDATTPDQIPAC